MSKKPPSILITRSEPIPILSKPQDTPVSSKSAPSRYEYDDFFVGSPASGLSLERSKKIETDFLSLSKLSKNKQIDDSIELDNPPIIGETNGDEYF